MNKSIGEMISLVRNAFMQIPKNSVLVFSNLNPCLNSIARESPDLHIDFLSFDNGLNSFMNTNTYLYKKTSSKLGDLLCLVNEFSFKTFKKYNVLSFRLQIKMAWVGYQNKVQVSMFVQSVYASTVSDQSLNVPP